MAKKKKSKRVKMVKAKTEAGAATNGSGNPMGRRAANNRHKLLKQLCAQYVKENEPKVYAALGDKAADVFPRMR